MVVSKPWAKKKKRAPVERSTISCATPKKTCSLHWTEHLFAWMPVKIQMFRSYAENTLSPKVR